MILKRWLVGDPLKTAQAADQRLSKTLALAIFSSNNISSVAYATEEILLVLVLAGTAAIAWSIPVSLAKDVLTQIIEHGHVIRGWLGVKIQDIDPQLAESFKLKSTDGVVVTNIVLNGPADKAGLDRGDVITHIDNKQVRDVRETLDQISQHKPGERINITIIRNGTEQSKQATVLERPVS